jgi:hypothetical protein
LIVVAYVPATPPAPNAADEAASAARTRATTARDRYGFMGIIDFLLPLTFVEARRPGRTAHRRQHQSRIGAGTEIR